MCNDMPLQGYCAPSFQQVELSPIAERQDALGNWTSYNHNRREDATFLETRTNPARIPHCTLVTQALQDDSGFFDFDALDELELIGHAG